MRRRAAGEDGWEMVKSCDCCFLCVATLPCTQARHGDCPEPMKGRMAGYRCSVRSMPMASFAVRDGT